MVSVLIDFSVVSENDAFGRLSGSVSVPLIPQVCDKISFPFSPKAVKEFNAERHARFVTNLFTVTGRTIAVNRDENSVQLSLQDLVVPARYDAEEVIRYFEMAHGLFGDIYGE